MEVGNGITHGCWLAYLRTYINHFFILFAKLIYSGIVLLIFFIVDM